MENSNRYRKWCSYWKQLYNVVSLSTPNHASFQTVFGRPSIVSEFMEEIKTQSGKLI